MSHQKWLNIAFFASIMAGTAAAGTPGEQVVAISAPPSNFQNAAIVEWKNQVRSTVVYATTEQAAGIRALNADLAAESNALGQAAVGLYAVTRAGVEWPNCDAVKTQAESVLNGVRTPYGYDRAVRLVQLAERTGCPAIMTLPLSYEPKNYQGLVGVNALAADPAFPVWIKNESLRYLGDLHGCVVKQMQVERLKGTPYSEAANRVKAECEEALPVIGG